MDFGGREVVLRRIGEPSLPPGRVGSREVLVMLMSRYLGEGASHVNDEGAQGVRF